MFSPTKDLTHPGPACRRGGIPPVCLSERTGLWEVTGTTKLTALAVALASATLFAQSAAPPAAPAQWTALTNQAPDYAGTMLLLTDGTVMVQGYDPGNNWMRLSPDASGNYGSGTWSDIAPMNTPRLYFASHVLPNGNVWVLGGEYIGNPLTPHWTNTGEMYDSTNNTWSPIAPHPDSIFGDDPSMLLPGGQILAGAIVSPKSYLYDVPTNTWSATGSKVYNDRSDEEGWVKLADGRVLTYDLFESIATGGSYAEVYDPQSGTWSGISPSDGTAAGFIPQLSSPAVGYELGPPVRLQDGRVFIIGATGHTALYTPSTNTWAAGPDVMGTLNGSPALFGADDAPAAVLPNGHVLFAADAGPTSGVFSGPTEIFDFDPASDAISLVQPPPQDPNLPYIPAFVVRMLVLPTGQVLMADSDTQLWLYTPSGSAPMLLRPRIRGRQVPTAAASSR